MLLSLLQADVLTTPAYALLNYGEVPGDGVCVSPVAKIEEVLCK